MERKSNLHLLLRIEELEKRLEDAEQLIEAIKAGEVDAFAISKANDESEIFTLQTGDYAYRVLIEEFGEGAINVTEEGLIVYTNRSFYDLLNMPYEKIIGSQVSDLIHPDSKDEFKMLFKKALAGKSKGEINLLSKDVIMPVYVSMTSLQPKLATVGIIVTDFSEKKKNEKIILEYQRSLENKNMELMKSNAELASFSYVASHDLQEPLRKIQTFSTRILEKEYANLSESGRSHFNRMEIAAKRMQTLIEDLITYSRTNMGERKFEVTDLRNIVEEVKTDLKEELQNKNVTISMDEMCTANIIPFQFRQLFLNLIRNSIKFSKPGHPPCIKVRSEIVSGIKSNNAKPSSQNYCHIHVSDNGIGFEPEYNEKIFEVFQRLHSNERYVGTGIGLAIVKKIVENHNGFITAKGELNKGAQFDIYVPAY
jgi:PAS domain S-box-containing protein